MLAIKILRAGDGFQYLSRQVASGDVALDRDDVLADYYAASGISPGRWFGRGTDGLRGELHRGAVVEHDAMTRLFRDGLDPTNGDPLGHPFSEHGGRGHPVAAFDLAFTVPKSASVLWALGDDRVRRAVIESHRAAVDQAIDFLEDKVVRTRVGQGGRRQVRTAGMLAAGFEHPDSRLSDPNLHTHLVVSNKVQGPDGAWRALDGRTMLRATVAVSGLYDGLVADELARRLGVRWSLRDRGERHNPAFAIDGLPDELLACFSRRTAQVDAAQEAWEETFAARHGRRPTPVEVIRKRQQLTRSTRPPKVRRTVAELFDEWANRARAATGREPRDLAARALGDDYHRGLHAHDVADETRDALVAQVVADVEARAATFCTWNLMAAATRATVVLRMASPGERLALVGELVSAAARDCVRLDDGGAARIGEEVFTTPATLVAEQDLMRVAGSNLRFGTPSAAQIELTLRRHPQLSGDQRAAAAAVLGSGRMVDAFVGPAGSGKTTTLRAVIGVWQRTYGAGVLALAPSATAAHVLENALGIRAETTAKWLFEGQRNVSRTTQVRELTIAARLAPYEDQVRLQQDIARLSGDVASWQLRRGQLVVLDEASLADTRTLAAITAQVADAGAKIVLVGDPAQRPAIGPAGGFGMLAHRHTTARLTALHRFVNAWEAVASIQVRTGDPAVIDAYQRNRRVSTGELDDLLDEAVTAAAADTSAGRVTLLQAADTRTVRELNARAHALAVFDGEAENAVGAPLADGARATVGDRVVTRRNDRQLRVPGGFVRNGDLWQVASTGSDGSLTLRPTSSREAGYTIRLPATYVRENVELGYATTTARSQGSTVDPTHTVVTAAMAREDLYVAVTRGRGRNQLYVPTEPVDPDCEPVRTPRRDAEERLREVLANSRAPMTATDTWAKHHPGEPLPIGPRRAQDPRTAIDPQISRAPSTTAIGSAPAGRMVER